MVKTIHTSDHPAAQIPGATIASLFAEWLEVRERCNTAATSGDIATADQLLPRISELADVIVDHMAPVSAKDLAMQIVVETSDGDNHLGDEFEARLLAFAKRKPSRAREPKDEREAKWNAAIDAFKVAAQEYDPTILSFLVCHGESGPGELNRFEGVWACRSRASENRAAQARGEIA